MVEGFDQTAENDENTLYNLDPHDNPEEMEDGMIRNDEVSQNSQTNPPGDAAVQWSNWILAKQKVKGRQALDPNIVGTSELDDPYYN